VTIEEFLAHLEGVQRHGEQWEGRCPAHDDEHASLSVTLGRKGIVLRCHAGCDSEAVVRAVGLSMSDLFYESATNGSYPAGTEAAARVTAATRRKPESLGAIEAVFDYHDAEGVLLFQVVRFEGKEFRQRRPDGRGGYIWGLGQVPRVLFNLPVVLRAVAANRPVFVAEGEKDVQTLGRHGLAGTTNPMGAGHWQAGYSSALRGARVVLMADNDDAGRKHRLEVARSLHGKAESIRFLDLPGLPEKGDVSDWFAAGGTYEEFGRLAREAPVWTPKTSGALCDIEVSDRPLRDMAKDAAHALELSNIPPHLFIRAGGLVRISPDENGRPVVETVTMHHMRGYLTRAADFVQQGKHGATHVSPPEHVVADVLVMGEWPLPPLANITETPVVRPDGTILELSGYDIATRLYYAPAGNLNAPRVPLTPTPEQVAAAVALLEDVFSEFPYVGDASRANLYGLLLTPILRPVISGPVPMALIDAPQRGTGKSLLAELVSIIATGRMAAMLSAPGDNDEWRKSLTSTFREAAAVITIDNVEGRLDAAALAMALTAPVWKDRILGSSTTFEFPIRCTWIATGNNISPGGDIPRRCYWIRLDALMSRPWQRTEFRHHDVRAWAFAHRGELVAALLILVRHWFAIGQPRVSVPPMGSFESWSQTVGNVLAAAGITGFLGNLEEMYEATDTGDQQWEAFLLQWEAIYGSTPRRVAEIASDLRSTVPRPGSPFTPDEAMLTLRELIPDEVRADVAEMSEDSLKKRLGRALLRKVSVRHGKDGLRVEKAGMDTAAKVERWKVVRD
jgi:hypothetical protein